MTASLPLSQEDPDDVSGPASTVPPPLPEISAADAAASQPPVKPRAPRKPRPPRATPAAPRPPKPPVAAAVVAAQFEADVPSAVAEEPAEAVATPQEEAAVEPAPAPRTPKRPAPRTPARKTSVVPVPAPAEPEDIPAPAETEDIPAPAELEVIPAPAELEDIDPGEAVDDIAPPAQVEPAVADPFEELPPVDVDAAVPALRMRGVSKAFGETRAVDQIDLEIPAGTFYGVVGPNGAGKTTTLSMIAGLLRPDRGTIEVAGVDVVADPARAKRMMGILPDRLRTFDRLTGRQLLHYYGVLRGLRPAVVDSRAADLARAFDLTDALGRTVADYSAGMTKKVMLAGAMIHSPRVLVLDEPFEAVDPVSSAVILDILKAYVAHGGTVILSSHGMDLVERVCSAVAVIVAGQVLAEGAVADVRGELTLEQRFVELAGGLSDVEGLEWLHTFSG